MKKVLVTGGTGVVGQSVVTHLVNNGYKVRVLSRSPACSSRSIEVLAEFLYGDITDSYALACAVKGVSIVFHLAAMVGTYSSSEQKFDQYKDELAQYRDINVKGTELLIKAAIEEGVDRVVFFSSISVYGKRKEAFAADEFTSLCPDSFYSISKAEAEKYVLAGVNHRGEPIGVVLRAASVYGPKEKKNYTRLIKMMKHGFFITIGHGMTKRTLIHDSDLARAAIVAAEHPEACGKIYNVTDGSVHSLNDLRKAIGKACGKKYINVFLPQFLVNFLISLLEKFSPGLSLASGMKNFVMDTAVLGNRIQDELGFKPAMELDKGWKDAVERT